MITNSEVQGWTEFKEISEAVKACIEIFALIIAGTWTYLIFVRQRQRYPRAKLEHRIKTWEISEERTLLRVCLLIHNAGNVIIRMESGFVNIQKLKPWPIPIAMGSPAPTSFVSSDSTVIDWPEVVTKYLPPDTKMHHVEPNESDEFHFDFTLDRNIELIEIYSYVKNKKLRSQDIGWSVTTIFNLSKNCVELTTQTEKQSEKSHEET